MKNSLILTLALLLISCGEGTPPVNEVTTADTAPGMTESERLTAWLDEEFATLLDFSPLTKTRLGDKSDYGELDDVSEAAMDRELALDDEGKVSWDLWEYQLQREEGALPFRRHGYTFGRNGPQTGLPNGLINYHNVESIADLEAYISRLNQSNRYLLQYLERAQLSVADGIRAPYFDYDRAMSEIQRVTSGAPFSDEGMSAIWEDITGKIENLVQEGIASAEEGHSLEQRAREALLQSFKPDYDEILAWLQEDRVNVPEGATGASELPDGEAYYAQRLEAMTTLPMTAR